jgi:hypothetical protein
MTEKRKPEKANEKINWKIAADRMTIGEKVELKSLPGFWVQPRRFSKSSEAEILAVTTRQQMKKASVRKAIVAAAKEGQEQGEKNLKSDIAQMRGEVLSDELQDRILTAVVDDMSAEELAGTETQLVKLAYGVHAHNFNGEPEGGSLEWARSLLEYRDIFNEILEIVEAKNAPLPLPTSGSSATSPTGSSTAPGSTKAAGTSTGSTP